MKTKQSVINWRMKNYEKYKVASRKHDREYYYRIRDELYQLLGDKCVKCGNEDRRVFQIDHVNGMGNSRKIKNRNGNGKTRKMLDEVRNGSKEYQLLCANCNIIKRMEKEEIIGHNIKARKDYISGMIRKGYAPIPK